MKGYVGVTTSFLSRRLAEHLSERDAGKKRNHRLNWLRKIAPATPVVDTLETCREAEMFEREKFWIRTMLAFGYELVNGTEGGEGRKGPLPESAKVKLSAINLGKKLSAETRARMKMAIRLRGAAMSGEMRQRWARATTGERGRMLGPAHAASTASWRTVERRALHTAVMSRLWKDPGYRDKNVESRYIRWAGTYGFKMLAEMIGERTTPFKPVTPIAKRGAGRRSVLPLS